MSDSSTQDLDGLDFSERTTKDRFNERLLEAQENNADNEIIGRIDFNDFYTSDGSEQLQKKFETLQAQVARMEAQVNDMENKLIIRKERRKLEASLTNMSPEERADHVIRQAEIQEDTPDLDIIFEYMLLLGSTSPNDTNDLSTTDFIKPHADIRKAAFESELVLKQKQFSNLQFTKADNILESNPDDEGKRRI
ncbi:uncharacterized protein EV154DRAFT_419347 [Mucor mucedo]|uniref:uncharacterized protein n=1 Tax=Mucor mucedo TaxID=29922 RepID=UPI00221F18E0|nr:uncharacterized protein EV154DRAFT_419347 [Mucor mucedo]KAI7892108.1 hypothetical protein EV154DRAFT_419347 [Mucor mucedo]